MTSHPGRGRLFVVAGPSGVGKSTVLARLRELLPGLWFSVSATTREPRPGEVNGREYYFLSRDEFDARVAAGAMLEHAEFAGHGYGTPRLPVQQRLDAGQDVLLEIEVQGARQVRAAAGTGPAAVLIFLAPPSLEVLADRLAARGTEDQDTVATRLQAAQRELAAQCEFDHVVTNEDVPAAAAALVDLMAGSRPGSPVG